MMAKMSSASKQMSSMLLGSFLVLLLLGQAAALDRLLKKPDSNIRHGKSKFEQE